MVAEFIETGEHSVRDLQLSGDNLSYFPGRGTVFELGSEFAAVVLEGFDEDNPNRELLKYAVDFSNPPEGIVPIGNPFPQALTEYLFDSMKLPLVEDGEFYNEDDMG